MMLAKCFFIAYPVQLVLVYVNHDDVIKWKHFPRNWPFVREIHRSPVNFPHKGQWRGALMFSLIYAWINDWVNNCEAGDLRSQHGHYDVIVMRHLTGVGCQLGILNRSSSIEIIHVHNTSLNHMVHPSHFVLYNKDGLDICGLHKMCHQHPQTQCNYTELSFSTQSNIYFWFYHVNGESWQLKLRCYIYIHNPNFVNILSTGAPFTVMD